MFAVYDVKDECGLYLSPTPPPGGSDNLALNQAGCPIPGRDVNHVCGLRCRGCPPGSAGVPPASLFLQTTCHPGPIPRKAHQTHLYGVRFHCATPNAGETPALPGGFRPHPYSCEHPPIQGHALAKRTETALKGTSSMGGSLPLPNPWQTLPNLHQRLSVSSSFFV